MRHEPVWRRYLRFWGSRPERDVDDEFRFHLQTKIDELRTRGFTAKQAREEAVRQFGPIGPRRAECVAIGKDMQRRASALEYLDGWLRDLRYALRALCRSRGTAVAVVAILATGIGITTAVFTLLDRIIYKPLPVHDPRGLVLVSKSLEAFDLAGYVQLRDHNAVFSGLAAEGGLFAREHRRGQKIARPAGAIFVSGNFFDVLGLHSLAGRTLTPADDVRSTASAVAVVGYRFAARRYEIPAQAVGQTIYLQDVPFTIVGVAPPGFYGMQKGYDVDVYAPLGSMSELFPGIKAYVGHPFGRLLPGISLARAESDINLLWRRLQPFKGGRITCESAARGFPGASGEQQRSLTLLGGIISLLLLIACANVGCLLLARGAARQHETAIRVSLGGSRWRILRIPILENALLALTGGAAAIAVAQWAGELLLVAFHWQKRPIDLTPDSRTLAFSVVVSLLCALLFGAAPTLQLLRGARVPLTQEQTAASFSSGRLLVAVEVALSLVLVAGAAAFIRSFQNLRAIPTGFDARQVSVVRVAGTAEADKIQPPLSDTAALMDSLRATDGVVSAGIASFVMFNDSFTQTFVRTAEAQRPDSAHMLLVDSGYFQTLRIPVLAGRGFTQHEDAATPHTAVISESLAHRLFPDRNPIGGRILVGRAVRNPKPGDELEVVGVVQDTKFSRVTAPPPAIVYLPLRFESDAQNQAWALEVRSTLEPPVLGAVVRGRIRLQHLALAVESATALDDEIGASLRDDFIRAQAASVFGVLALLLIASGLYGIMAYSVARRTREIGIRMAVGSSASGILALVVRQSLRLVALGIAVGIPGAAAALRALHKFVYGLPPIDFPSLFMAAAVLLCAGGAAALLPAWRAAHLDPVRALRAQ